MPNSWSEGEPEMVCSWKNSYRQSSSRGYQTPVVVSQCKRCLKCASVFVGIGGRISVCVCVFMYSGSLSIDIYRVYHTKKSSLKWNKETQRPPTTKFLSHSLVVLFNWDVQFVDPGCMSSAWKFITPYLNVRFWLNNFDKTIIEVSCQPPVHQKILEHV